VTISGNFISRTFDGDYNAIPKFIRVMDQYLAESGKKAKDYYVHYAYCPKCAKKFGHNYMILFAEVQNN
ncbi:MAG: hydrolase, partial [Actinomycetota bacterium]